tara:strand:+ start:33210 stop:34277 length:1068 start_codon:yes stop_codon:yes gene_type:complete
VKRAFLTLICIMMSYSCTYDYGIITPGEKEYVYITETETVVETETETVEVEVEVPVYIEIEVPVYIEDTAIDDPGLIWVDSFVQPNTVDGIDILWVIDTSGSMYRYETQLLLGIETMLGALPPTSWRLAMISNDPARSVLESQFPLVPGDDILDAEAMYSAMGRGGHEEGFDATYEYVINNPYAATWMRPDAGLLVVFVSDEEEQSNDHFLAVSDFVSWYRSLRGGSVFLASIVNHDPSVSLCDYSPSYMDIGSRYMEATTSFGGNIIDICADDWSPGVADAAASIEPHESWPLTHTAVADSVRVFINGVVQDPGMLTWTYSATDNTVYFTAVPPGSALVEIGYRYYEAGADTGT